MEKKLQFLLKFNLRITGIIAVLVAALILGVISVPTLIHAAAPVASQSLTHKTSVPVVYQIHTDRSIWVYTGTPLTGWQEIGSPNTQTASIVSSKSHLYQLHLDGTIWLYKGTPLTGWQEIDNSQLAATISVSITGGYLYKANQDGSVWQYNGTPLTGWTNRSGLSTYTTPTAGPNGTLYGIRSDGVWKYTVLTGWQQIDNTLVNGYNAAMELAATPDGKLYQSRIDANNVSSIWIYTSGMSWRQIDNNQNASYILGDGNNKLYQLTPAGIIWQYNGTSWTSLNNPQPNLTTNFRVSVSGQVYQIQRNGAVWLDNNGTWQQIDNNPTTFWIMSNAGGNGVNFAG